MVSSPLTGPGAIVSLVILGIILILRTTRFTLNQVGRARYRPASPQPNRTATANNCSVILPIMYPHDPNLEDCAHSILANFPAHLYIVTVGVEARNQVEGKLGHLRALYGATQINVGAVNKANKRRQIAHALSNISTSVTAITDQGVYWPKTFLGSALLPFDDINVAAVSVPKLARKPVPKHAWGSFWACLISCYHALSADENRAVNALDHSALFGGSTVLFRTYHCATEEFKRKFENETCFFGRSGVLKEDEHCFLNRHFLQHACDVAFQDTPEATIQVDQGSILEFMGEYLRTTRNTWRLSISMLTHETLMIHPLGCFLTWLSSLVSFTILTDALIIILMYYNGIFDETLVLWLGVGISLLIVQLLVALQVVMRVRRSGGKFNWLTILMCIILSFPAQYALELLRVVALLTFWKGKTEDCKPLDLEQRGERHEPPWIWGFMEMIDTPPPSWDPESENPIFTVE
ncbi:hypothetical protein FSARC_2279 [Fusarium sarcochroum]|uniref:Ceramide glucosyltransferase n=1 Tax=Fusarium sarcochroum TaxID=1208366 RepID=A0A8H4U6P7_9HYPO|nr:hypothetical protein FSARC_2279 [Fusarium sarcochroum]